MTHHTGLENRRGWKLTVGSNPTLSATSGCALTRVVKYDAEREALALANFADAVAHLDAVGAARSGSRCFVDREHDRVTHPQRHDMQAGLHPRALFGQDEFAALEILSGLGQQDRHLKREMEVAVKILMEAIIIAGTIP